MAALCALAPVRAALGEPAPVTLEQARRLALERHPRVRAAAARVRQAAARLAEARSLYSPRVLAAGEYLRATSNNSPTTVLSLPNLPRVGGPTRDPRLESFDNAFLGLTSEVTIYDFGATRAAVDEAGARLESTKASLRVGQSDLLLVVDDAYVTTLATRAARRVLDEALARASSHHELVAAGVKSGLRGKIELARVDAEVAGARVAVIRAAGAERLARQALADAIGAPDDEADAAAEPPAVELVVRADAVLAEARQRRPELAALRAELRVLEAQRAAVRATYLPRLYATAALSTRGQLTPDVYNWDVGAVLAWPIFTGLSTEHQLEAADARIAELSELVRQADLQISSEVRRALTALEVAREAITASQVQLAAARVALELAEGRYQQGLGNMIELADAGAGRSNAELGLVQARLELARAQALHDHARGR